MGNHLRQWLVLGSWVVAASAAWAAPTASLPSMTKVGKGVELRGSDFAAGTMVTVRITTAQGSVSLAAVVVAPDGSFSHTVVPATPGKLRVELLNASGQVLAKADAGVAP